MSEYLKIAEEVLKQARRPLSPRTILDKAYLAGLVPAEFHGKTQHKTLQARLSEDIVKHRERSRFFRTAPGFFFLRQFISDESIPEKHRQPIVAKRRVRELHQGYELGVPISIAMPMLRSNSYIDKQTIFDTLGSLDRIYYNRKQEGSCTIFLWAFALVRRSNKILSYRIGKYREHKDSFLLKRSIGFCTPVSERDLSFWNDSEYGIADAAERAAKIDLDLIDDGPYDRECTPTKLQYFITHSESASSGAIIGVVDYQCPPWFEPEQRRLSILDLQWLDLRSQINDLDDFDPWSRRVLENEYGKRRINP